MIIISYFHRDERNSPRLDWNAKIDTFARGTNFVRNIDRVAYMLSETKYKKGLHIWACPTSAKQIGNEKVVAGMPARIISYTQPKTRCCGRSTLTPSVPFTNAYHSFNYSRFADHTANSYFLSLLSQLPINPFYFLSFHFIFFSVRTHSPLSFKVNLWFLNYQFVMSNKSFFWYFWISIQSLVFLQFQNFLLFLMICCFAKRLCLRIRMLFIGYFVKTYD